MAFAGKGGVGKTSATAWLGDYLARQGEDVWLIDADTALSLAVACGLNLENVPQSLAKNEALIREYVGEGMMCLNPDLVGLPQKLALEMPLIGPVHQGVKAGKKRLLLMGGVEAGGAGCACGAHSLLKAFLAHMLYKEAGHVLLDMDAGVEHLGRGTAAVVDGVVVVSEPSLRSLNTAADVARLAGQLGLTRQVLLLNRHEGQRLPSPLPSALAFLPRLVITMPLLHELHARQWEHGSVLFEGGTTLDAADAMCAALVQAFLPSPEQVM